MRRLSAGIYWIVCNSQQCPDGYGLQLVENSKDSFVSSSNQFLVVISSNSFSEEFNHQIPRIQDSFLRYSRVIQSESTNQKSALCLVIQRTSIILIFPRLNSWTVLQLRVAPLCCYLNTIKASLSIGKTNDARY